MGLIALGLIKGSVVAYVLIFTILYPPIVIILLAVIEKLKDVHDKRKR